MEEIQAKIQEFFDINAHTVTSPVILWDAFKATIRGSIIAISVRLHKQRTEQLERIEGDIKTMEKLYSHHPNKQTLTAINKQIYTFKSISCEIARKSTLKTRAVYNVEANRAGKTLARCLNPKQD